MNGQNRNRARDYLAMQIARKAAEQLRMDNIKYKSTNPMIPNDVLREFRNWCSPEDRLYEPLMIYKTYDIVRITRYPDNFHRIYDATLLSVSTDPQQKESNTEKAIHMARNELYEFLEKCCRTVEARTKSLRGGAETFCYKLLTQEEIEARAALQVHDSYSPVHEMPNFLDLEEEYFEQEEDQQDVVEGDQFAMDE